MMRRGASARTAKAKALDAQNKYDAAGNGRRIAGWNPGTRGPLTATAEVQRLIDRAQDAVRNDWAASSTTQKWATSLVGVAITPRWKNKHYRELWEAQVPTMDADCVLDAYGLQTLGVREWLADGEVFLRNRPRDLALPLAAPMQAQLIPSAFCPRFDALVWPGMPQGNEIKQGIEVNKYGRRVAFWMFKRHPHDQNASPLPINLIRIPASQISHCFEPKRVGQMRGVSELAPILVRLRNSADFEDAVLDRQKLANLFVTFITRALPDLGADDLDPDTGLPKWYDKKGSPLVGLEPGTQQELMPGEGVTFANPPEAGVSYPEYMRSTHLGTAAGGGLPYELMSGDIKDVSDRTLRVVINEFRRFARQRQWQIVIPMLCQPVVNWWADALYLKGDIGESEIAEVKRAKWSPEGWAYIHPTQDAQGKRIELDMGVTSRERLAGERGDDIEEIDKEREADLKRSKEMGLEPPPPAAGQPGGPPKKPDPRAERHIEAQTRLIEAQATVLEKPAPAAGPSTAETIVAAMAPVMAEMQRSNAAGMAQLQEMQRAQAEALLSVQAASVERIAALAQAAIERSITVENNVAPAAVSVTNEVQPTPIEMTNTVNIEPTPITNILEQTIEAKAGEVNVNLPDRKIESVIDRDRDGNITHVEQIETTLEPKKGG